MKTYLYAIWLWLVTSSADPEKTSVALQAALALGGAYLLQAVVFACALHLFCAPIDKDTIDQVIFAIVGFFLVVMKGGSFLIMLWGIGRKIYYGRWSAPQIA
jgi:hypothetical protein